VQDQGETAIWVVTGCDPCYPGKLVARPHTCRQDGGRFVTCVLMSDSLANLRAHDKRICIGCTASTVTSSPSNTFTPSMSHPRLSSEGDTG